MKPLTLLAIAFTLASCARKPEATVAVSSAAPAPAPQPGVADIAPGSPQLQQIRVAAAAAAAVPTDEVVSPGKIEMNPNRVSRVVLPVPGRISTVTVKIGESVERGQPLVTLESPDADAAESLYIQAQVSLNTARVNANKAQADYDRSADLFAHNAVARKDVLNFENALAQAKAAVDTANANIEQTRRRIVLLGLTPGTFGQRVTVNAPLAGKVMDMAIAPGEYRNDTNTPLMTIADLSTVWVSSDVPESSIRLIKIGERFDISLAAYPGETFRGRVTRIADTVDPQTRTIKVRAEMDNPRGRLRPEMFGTIRHTEGTRVMTVLPVGAVLQENGRNVVFVENPPGHFQQTEVTVGPRFNDVLPILTGVKTGDRVVVDGAMLLK